MPLLEKSFIALLWLSCILLSLVFALAWIRPPWYDLNFHVVFGGIVTLLGLFAHISTLFYFIGTSIWMRDQSREILPKNKKAAMEIWQHYQGANRLKAYSMPFPTFGIFAGLFGFIFGGAIHVGAVDTWIHIAITSLFVFCTWMGLIMAQIGLKKNLHFLDLTSKVLDSLEKSHES